MTRRSTVFLLLAALPFWTGCTPPPITVVERVVEARSTSDIVEDNRIVIEVNRIMADLGTIKASTDIYEQRLLVTGMFDNQSQYNQFQRRVEAVRGVKKLYWHVTYMSEAEQKRRSGELLDWGEALALSTKVSANLVGTRGIADVNYRLAVDPFSTVYVVGRARSNEEHDKVINVVRNLTGVRRVVDYIETRP